MKRNLLPALGLFAILSSVACGRAIRENGGRDPANNLNSENAEVARLADPSHSASAIEEMLDESSLAVEQVNEVSRSESSVQTSVLLAAEDVLPFGQKSVAQKVLAGSRGKNLRSVCAEDKDLGQTTVEIFRGMSSSRAFVGAGLNAARSVGAQEYIKRIWSLDGQSISCNEDSTAAVVDGSNLNGMTLSVEFRRGKAEKSGFDFSIGQKNAAFKGGFLAEGSRNLSFTSSESSEGLLKRATIISTVKRQFKSKRLGNEAENVSVTLQTADQKPLVVSSLHDIATGELKTRTIESGTFVATGKDGAKVETVFSNVVYVKSGACLRPESGTIAGTITLAEGGDGDGDGVKTFQATYSVDSVVLVLPNGETRVNNHSCGAEKE